MELVFFFFFKQKTAYEIRKGDWSSDVCSSDLPFVVEELSGEGLEERPEGILVLVDRREELGPFRLQIRLELVDVRRPEGEVLHVRLRVLLRLPREAVREGRL